jgi:putative phosphoesterase
MDNRNQGKNVKTPKKRIGVISDTHIPTRAQKIPSKVFEVFKKVDLIIHAGDVVEWSVIDNLEQLAPVCAVHGNMDGSHMRERLPERNEVTIENWRIGVMHDPRILFGVRTMQNIATQHHYDIFIYGHTHRSNIRWVEGHLFLNPGSPTNPLPPFLTKPTIALLTLTKEAIHPELITLPR